jgi:hypothetical protein
MSHDLTWVIDFRNSDTNLIYDQILSKDWCKIHKIEALISGDFTEKKVKEYFEFFTYSKELKDFWSAEEIRNPRKINIVLLAEDEKIINASLFSYYLKQNTVNFLNQIGLGPSSAINCYLCSYWDNTWTFEEKGAKISNLYSLNLFQNIPVATRRPFDFVYIFKDINAGLGQNEYRNRKSNREYFDTKITALVFHISCNEHNKQIDSIWCGSFGASHIYFNAEELYSKSAKEIANLIVQELINKENEPWELQQNQPLSEKLKSLEFSAVFNSLKFTNTTSQFGKSTEFYKHDFSSLWDWFSIANLKAFFNDSLSEILFKLKSGKVDYLFNEYNLMRTGVDTNFNVLVNEELSKLNTPSLIFDDYFKHKPFSFLSYRKGILELIDIVEKRRLENKEAFEKGYLDPEMPYSPCSMSPEVLVKYNYFVNEYKEKPDILYSNVAENQVLELKEKAESIPHPVSLLLKTFVLSSIVALFAYIPLNNLLENNVYTLLGSFILFILPFVFMWKNFKNNATKLAEYCDEFEALNKFFVTKKLNEYIFKKVDSLYLEYLNQCKLELANIEKKTIEAERFLSSQKNYKKEGVIDSLSIRNANSIAREVPPIKIEINGENFETKDLMNDFTKLFQYFKQTIGNDSIKLSQLLTSEFDHLMDIIIDQLKNSKDNISSAADLLFPSVGQNIKPEEKELMLSLLPPYNNGDPSIDNFSCEVLIDSYKLEGAEADAIIIEIIDPKLKLEKIKRSNSSSGFISILTNNTNSLNCYTLFSSSLGGNQVSFIEHTKNYYETRREQFVNIVRIVIKETIENSKIETTAGREEVFSLVMKGFDSKFDEDGWEVFISDIDSVSNPFVKELRQLFKNEFENTLSIYLTAIS